MTRGARGELGMLVMARWEAWGGFERALDLEEVGPKFPWNLPSVRLDVNGVDLGLETSWANECVVLAV